MTRAQRISAALMGHVVSAETRAKISASNTGKRQSPETCAKKAAAGLGRRVSDETRLRLSMAGKGRRLSPEQCTHMSAVRKGVPLTTECRAKISAALTGRRQTDEHKASVYAACERAREQGRCVVHHSRRYTKLAQALHAHLLSIGLVLEPEVRFGRFTVDLYDRTNHVAYEADGTYWHQRNEAARPGYHARRDRELRARHGLRVIRYSDAEIGALSSAAVAAA